MIEGDPKKDEFDKEDFERFRVLRSTLLKWRLMTRSESLPSIDISLKGRAKELSKPILQIAHGTSHFNNLSDLFIDESKEKAEERRTSFEGRLAAIICGPFKNHKEPILFEEIWAKLSDSSGAKIMDKNKLYITEIGEVSKNLVGYRIREVFKGKKTTVRVYKNAERAYHFDPDTLTKMAKKYSIEQNAITPSQ